MGGTMIRAKKLAAIWLRRQAVQIRRKAVEDYDYEDHTTLAIYGAHGREIDELYELLPKVENLLGKLAKYPEFKELHGNAFDALTEFGLAVYEANTNHFGAEVMEQ